MTKTSTFSLHDSAAVTVTGQSREFPEIENFDQIVIYIDISAASGTTPTFDFMVKVRNPVTGDLYNITDDFEFRDENGALLVLTATAEGNALRFISATLPGAEARGKLKSGLYLVDKALVARWLVGGTTPSFTFT